MRDFLKSGGRYLSVGWFWAFVLLVLPNCSFTAPLTGPGRNLNPGSAPHGSVIFCDIEKDIGRHCASAEEKATGIRLAAGAVALVAGQTRSFGLDDSPDALARCAGEPEAVVFQGAFPEGYSVCVNCGDVIGTASYPNANAACVAQCEDFVGTTNAQGTFVPDNPPAPETVAFCEAHARASTNFPQNECFADACTTAGMLRPDFADPRRIPEAVIWGNLIGVTATGGSLTRTAASSGSWDAGAASSQVIASGDGYVEFTATETNTSRFGGLSSGAPPDTDPNFTGIGFGIELFITGDLHVFESGSAVQTFGAYAPGEKFRVRVRDNFNGTATISYARVTGPCVDGTPCNETVFHTSSVAGAYPFRVDSAFLDQGATLTDVRLVRIR